MQILVNRSIILQNLPAFNNKVEVLEQNQGVADIMQGIKDWHKKFASHYNRIAKYFIGHNDIQTCKNVFQFLKDNTKYVMEPIEVQTVRGPAAIVATGNTIGIDCKNYALFIGGVLDAVNRSGIQNIPFVYRFASYDYFNSEPEHVFIVAFPGTQDEIWIDPVLEKFNQREPQPFHYTDKKFKAMLHGISGVQNQPIGAIDFGQVLNFGASFIPGASPIVGMAQNIFGGLFQNTSGESNVDEKVKEILQVTPLRPDINYLINAIPGLEAQLPIAQNLAQNGANAYQKARGAAYYQAYSRVIEMFKQGIAQLQQQQQQQNNQNNQNAPGSNNTLLYVGAALLAAKFLF